MPAGQIFVMGDHRVVSQDARCQGPVPIENVIGRAFVDRLADRPVGYAQRAGDLRARAWTGRRWPTTGLGVHRRDVGAASVSLPVLASLVVTTRDRDGSRDGHDVRFAGD